MSSKMYSVVITYVKRLEMLSNFRICSKIFKWNIYESRCGWSDLKPHSQFLPSLLPVVGGSGCNSGQTRSLLGGSLQKVLFFSDKKRNSSVGHTFLCQFAVSQLFPVWYMWCLEMQQPACSLKAARMRKWPCVKDDGPESWNEPGSQVAGPPADCVLCKKNNPYLFVLL